MFFQEISISARDQVDDVFRVGCERADSFEGSLGGDGLRGNFDNGCEGTLTSAGHAKNYLDKVPKPTS